MSLPFRIDPPKDPARAERMARAARMANAAWRVERDRLGLGPSRRRRDMPPEPEWDDETEAEP